MQKITIWSTANGYIVKTPHPEGEGFLYQVCEVAETYNEKSLAQSEAETLASVLYKVIDALAPLEITSRYSSARVKVIVEPGDKYDESPDSDLA